MPDPLVVLLYQRLLPTFSLQSSHYRCLAASKSGKPIACTISEYHLWVHVQVPSNVRGAPIIYIRILGFTMSSMSQEAVLKKVLKPNGLPAMSSSIWCRMIQSKCSTISTH